MAAYYYGLAAGCRARGEGEDLVAQFIIITSVTERAIFGFTSKVWRRNKRTSYFGKKEFLSMGIFLPVSLTKMCDVEPR
eukprot:scaffold2370_cov102-Skeletonema_dohrnii-CCMP3373.AAC.4